MRMPETILEHSIRADFASHRKLTDSDGQIVGGCFSSQCQTKTTNMGCTPSRTSDKHCRRHHSWPTPLQRGFTSISQVAAAARTAGFSSAELVVGIDFSLSNRSHPTGLTRATLSESQRQRTSQIIDAASRVLALPAFGAHHPRIAAFGFGDETTKHNGCFHLSGGAVLSGDALLRRYQALRELQGVGGATGFSPVIKQAINLARHTGKHQVLVIITDNEIQNDRGRTAQAIVEASHYPISIILVGVGGGSWGAMERYAEDLPQRSFQNFSFVRYGEVVESVSKGQGSKCLNPEATSLPGNTAHEERMMKMSGSTNEQVLKAQLSLRMVMPIARHARHIREAGLLDTDNYPQCSVPGLAMMCPEQLAPLAPAPATPKGASSAVRARQVQIKEAHVIPVGLPVQNDAIQLVQKYIIDSLTPTNSQSHGLSARKNDLEGTDPDVSYETILQGRPTVFHAW